MKNFIANDKVFVCIPGQEPYVALVAESQNSETIMLIREINTDSVSDRERVEVSERYVYRDYTGFASSFNRLSEHVHDNAVSKGFWEEQRNFGEMIALMHSELSEALEAQRSGNPTSEKIPQFSHVEEEFADCIVRIMDTACGLGLNVGGAILAKIEFNHSRPYRHGRKF